MSNTYFSLSLNLYKHACSNNKKNATVLYPRSGNFTLKCLWAAAFSYSAAYWPISALSVSEKLVYRFCFFVLCWLACFSNTRFTPPFASRVATAQIPVSLWLGSQVAWVLDYCCLYLSCVRATNTTQSLWETTVGILKKSCCHQKHCGSIHTALAYEVSKQPHARHHLR